MTINDRVRLLRKEYLHITQEVFGEKLGLTRANIANIESGRIGVTSRVILDICKEYNVNEKWLHEGIGEVIKQRTEDEEIADFLADVLSKEEETFQKKLISGLCKLSPEQWGQLEKIIDVMSF